MDRLSVLCFAGTYGLALASDLSRFAVRSAVRWYLTVGLTALAWAVQGAYLANLAWSGRRVPVTTAFESLLALSWILAAIDLYLTLRAPRPSAVGLFVLPLVLALVIVAGLSTSPQQADWGSWGGVTAFWGTVHGVFLVAGAVSTCVAFVAGLMHLLQSHRLKRKRPSRFEFALPSLEQSERLNRGAITVAFPLLTFGLLIGVVLGLASPGPDGVHLSWSDPKVLSALAMWLVFAALLHARYRPEMRGRRVMWLTALAFAFLVFSWVGVDILRLPSAHHGTPRESGRRS